jgi:hypothetical protein
MLEHDSTNSVLRVLRNVYALERFEGIDYDYTMSSIPTKRTLVQQKEPKHSGDEL